MDERSLKNYFLDTLASSDFKQCDLVDYNQAFQAITNVINSPDAKFSEAERAWSLISPFLWERGFVKANARTK